MMDIGPQEVKASVEGEKEDFIKNVSDHLMNWDVEDQYELINALKETLQKRLDKEREKVQDHLIFIERKLYYLHNGHHRDEQIKESRTPQSPRYGE